MIIVTSKILNKFQRREYLINKLIPLCDFSVIKFISMRLSKIKSTTPLFSSK